jgi:hypothetical protein
VYGVFAKKAFITFKSLPSTIRFQNFEILFLITKKYNPKNYKSIKLICKFILLPKIPKKELKIIVDVIDVKSFQ